MRSARRRADACRRSARRAGERVHDFDGDRGFSGARLDRPALDQLRDAVADGHVDTVIVASGGLNKIAVLASVLQGKLCNVLIADEASARAALGIVRGATLLANVISSSMDVHARFGGVVPEIAARAHLEALKPTLNKALAEAKVSLADIDAIAVTNGPGLAGALMVGIGAAKALSVATGKPIYAVNHLVGHVGVDVLEGQLELPTVALLVSGGHTSLLLVRDLLTDVEMLGETIDDAAGEAFDKVARVLDLPYPGGPEIDRAAVGGDPKAIRFPRGLTLPKDLEKHRYNFSLSRG